MSTKINLNMDQGSEFEVSFDLKSDEGRIDLTNYVGRSQMRRQVSSNVAASFDVSLFSNGTVTIGLTSSQTANVIPDDYLYDVEVVDSSNNVFRVVEGIITVTPNITR